MTVRLRWPGPAPMVKDWANYLPLGFREIGADVLLEPWLWDRVDLRFHVYPAVLELDNRRYRIWYDIDDVPSPTQIDRPDAKFRRAHKALVRTDRDFYFKIQMPLGFEAPHAFPICQIALQTVLDNLTDLRALHKMPPEYDVSAMFRHTDHGDRNRAALAVKAQTQWRSVTTVSPRVDRPEPSPEVYRRLPLPRMEYLVNIAKSKISLALPGVGADWTWRHTEIWAIGTCMATYKPLYQLPGNPKGLWIEIARDQSNLIEALTAALADDELRAHVARRGRQYFEDYASPAAQARYIIDTVREHTS